jgi:sulfonate dioxygenase
MAPVAVAASAPTVTDLKKEETTFNPFYSPNIADDGNDQYEYAKYKVRVRDFDP